MAENTPRNVAFRTSAMAAIFSAVIYGVSSCFLVGTIDWRIMGIILSFSFAGGYFINSWAIEKFIYQKVKVIYKTIHRLKRTPENRVELGMGEDVLEEVKKDVLGWADDRVKEVEDLEERDNYRRDFIGNLSHELKTPVFNIQGYVLTLLEGALEDEENNRKFLEKAERSVQRMVNLLEDLDRINKIESGALELEMEPMDISEVSQEIVDSLEQKARKANVNLRLKHPESSFPVIGDRMRIEQVLTNLLVNSINYGQDGGETLLRFYDMGENVLVEVADNGIGMSESHLSRVWERFYRVDKSRSRDSGGSGLGLAIVKHIIEAHGQTINVRSTKDVGSTFAFTLKKA
jgi:two-component system phosphate regulon sensor histidine kinase PhoR